MSRPAACCVSSTAAGSTYRRQAWSSRVARSQDSGSSQLGEGRLGDDDAFQRGAQGASNPSRSSSRANRDRCSSARKSSRSPLTDTPHFLLADQAQIVALERRLHRFEAVLHPRDRSVDQGRCRNRAARGARRQSQLLPAQAVVAGVVRVPGMSFATYTVMWPWS